MRIGIVGYGVVGMAISRMVSWQDDNELVIYDRYKEPFSEPWRRKAINTCELVFLCVPTPTDENGCDISIVEKCASWITVPLLIRSTVVPGTIERLTVATGNSDIAFSPEYIGESPLHPWREEGDCGFLIVGGPGSVFDLSRKLYDRCVGPRLRYFHTSARTAELCKYMENCFLATKVAFVNQFFDVARAMNVDFEELRKLWLADPRIGESHTMVTAERSFGGRCLPKDLAALIAAMRQLGGAPLLQAVSDYNRHLSEASHGRDQHKVAVDSSSVSITPVSL